MRKLSIILHCCSIIHTLRALFSSRAPLFRARLNNINSHNPSTSQIMRLDDRQTDGPLRVLPSAILDDTPSFNNIIDGANWIDLNIPASELRPNYTLIMGQCFNWKRIDATGNDLNPICNYKSKPYSRSNSHRNSSRNSEPNSYPNSYPNSALVTLTDKAVTGRSPPAGLAY